MKIPNGDRADLGVKLEDYSLNSFHRQGQHKARVFESVLGITSANADVLRTALLNAAANSEGAIYKGNNGHGEVYELRFSLTTPKATSTVLSAWIIRAGEAFPRLNHMLYTLRPMSDEIHLHDIVALMENTPTRHFLTGQQLMLRRGQIGTVVMSYDSTTFEVEFAGRDGRAYAILPINAENLMVLRDTLEPAAV